MPLGSKVLLYYMTNVLSYLLVVRRIWLLSAYCLLSTHIYLGQNFFIKGLINMNKQYLTTPTLMLRENKCHRVCSRSGSGNRRIVLV